MEHLRRQSLALSRYSKQWEQSKTSHGNGELCRMVPSSFLCSYLCQWKKFFLFGSAGATYPWRKLVCPWCRHLPIAVLDVFLIGANRQTFGDLSADELFLNFLGLLCWRKERLIVGVIGCAMRKQCVYSGAMRHVTVNCSLLRQNLWNIVQSTVLLPIDDIDVVGGTNVRICFGSHIITVVDFLGGEGHDFGVELASHAISWFLFSLCYSICCFERSTLRSIADCQLDPNRSIDFSREVPCSISSCRVTFFFVLQ